MSARQAEELKAKFISVVSHELRIPMTSIKGQAELLRQGTVGPVNEQQTEFLNIVPNNVGRIFVLITNLSDLSKLESGWLKLDGKF